MRGFKEKREWIRCITKKVKENWKKTKIKIINKEATIKIIIIIISTQKQSRSSKLTREKLTSLEITNKNQV